MPTTPLLARSLFIAAACAGTACGRASDAPLAPIVPGPAASVKIIYGGSQRGFTGDVLQPVIVQLIDTLGRAVADQRHLQFSIVRGGGSVGDTSTATDGLGRMAVNWTLGPEPGLQELAIGLAGADTVASPPIIVLATAVSPDEADRVVIAGMSAGTAGVLIQQDATTETYSLTWPDTVLRLMPRGPVGSWQQVTVFSRGHPPEARINPWTAGVDTVRLALRDPIAVPFTVWAVLNYDTTAAKARLDLADLDQLWQSQTTGLRVGTVRIEPASDASGMTSCSSDTYGHVDPAAINVYYVASVAEVGGHGGVTCSPGRILMGPGSPLGFRPTPDYLFAHEVGHTMSLDHVSIPGNVMLPVDPYSPGLTTGQIYWMHFNSGSALNVVLGIHPTAEQNCRATPVSYCPPQSYAVF